MPLNLIILILVSFSIGFGCLGLSYLYERLSQEEEQERKSVFWRFR
jgi:hypothetical protein